MISFFISFFFFCFVLISYFFFYTFSIFLFFAILLFLLSYFFLSIFFVVFFLSFRSCCFSYHRHFSSFLSLVFRFQISVVFSFSFCFDFLPSFICFLYSTIPFSVERTRLSFIPNSVTHTPTPVSLQKYLPYCNTNLISKNDNNKNGIPRIHILL